MKDKTIASSVWEEVEREGREKRGREEVLNMSSICTKDPPIWHGADTSHNKGRGSWAQSGR